MNLKYKKSYVTYYKSGLKLYLKRGRQEYRVFVKKNNE